MSSTAAEFMRRFQERLSETDLEMFASTNKEKAIPPAQKHNSGLSTSGMQAADRTLPIPNTRTSPTFLGHHPPEGIPIATTDAFGNSASRPGSIPMNLHNSGPFHTPFQNAPLHSTFESRVNGITGSLEHAAAAALALCSSIPPGTSGSPSMAHHGSPSNLEPPSSTGKRDLLSSTSGSSTSSSSKNSAPATKTVRFGPPVDDSGMYGSIPISEVVAARDRAHAQIRSLLETMSALSNELSSAKELNVVVTNEKESLESAHASAMERLRNMETEKKQMVGKWSAEKTSLEIRVVSLEETENSLRKEVESLKSELVQERERAEEATATAKAHVQEELKLLRALKENSAMQKDLNVAKSRILELEHELEVAKEAAAKQEAKLKEAATIIQEFTSNTLHDRVKQMEKEKKEALEALRTMRETMQQERANISSTLNDFQTAIVEQANKIAAQEKELRTEKGRNAELLERKNHESQMISRLLQMVSVHDPDFSPSDFLKQNDITSALAYSRVGGEELKTGDMYFIQSPSQALTRSRLWAQVHPGPTATTRDAGLPSLSIEQLDQQDSANQATYATGLESIVQVTQKRMAALSIGNVLKAAVNRRLRHALSHLALETLVSRAAKRNQAIDAIQSSLNSNAAGAASKGSTSVLSEEGKIRLDALVAQASNLSSSADPTATTSGDRSLFGRLVHEALINNTVLELLPPLALPLVHLSSIRKESAKPGEASGALTTTDLSAPAATVADAKAAHGSNANLNQMGRRVVERRRSVDSMRPPLFTRTPQNTIQEPLTRSHLSTPDSKTRYFARSTPETPSYPVPGDQSLQNLCRTLQEIVKQSYSQTEKLLLELKEDEILDTGVHTSFSSLSSSLRNSRFSLSDSTSPSQRRAVQQKLVHTLLELLHKASDITSSVLRMQADYAHYHHAGAPVLSSRGGIGGNDTPASGASLDLNTRLKAHLESALQKSDSLETELMLSRKEARTLRSRLRALRKEVFSLLKTVGVDSSLSAKQDDEETAIPKTQTALAKPEDAPMDLTTLANSLSRDAVDPFDLDAILTTPAPFPPSAQSGTAHVGSPLSTLSPNAGKSSVSAESNDMLVTNEAVEFASLSVVSLRDKLASLCAILEAFFQSAKAPITSDALQKLQLFHQIDNSDKKTSFSSLFALFDAFETLVLTLSEASNDPSSISQQFDAFISSYQLEKNREQNRLQLAKERLIEAEVVEESIVQARTEIDREIQNLRDLIRNKDTTIYETNALVLSLEKDKQELEVEIDKLKTTIAEYDEMKTIMDAKIEASKESFVNSELRIRELQEEKAKLEAALTESRNVTTKAQQDLESIKKKTKDVLESAKAGFLAEATAVSKQREDALNRVNILEGKLQMAETQLTDAQERINKLEEQLNDANEQLEELQKENEEKKSTMESLQLALQQAEERCLELSQMHESELERHSGLVGSARKEHDEALKEMETKLFEEHAARLKETTETYETHLHDLKVAHQKELDQLRLEHSDVVNAMMLESGLEKEKLTANYAEEIKALQNGFQQRLAAQESELRLQFREEKAKFVSDFETRVASMKRDISSSLEESIAAREKIRQAEEEKSDLMRKLRVAELKESEVEAKYHELNSKYSTLVTEAKAERDALQKCRVEIEALQVDVELKKAEINALQNAKEALLDDLENTKLDSQLAIQAAEDRAKAYISKHLAEARMASLHTDSIRR